MSKKQKPSFLRQAIEEIQMRRKVTALVLGRFNCLCQTLRQRAGDGCELCNPPGKKKSS